MASQCEKCLDGDPQRTVVDFLSNPQRQRGTITTKRCFYYAYIIVFVTVNDAKYWVSLVVRFCKLSGLNGLDKYRVTYGSSCHGAGGWLNGDCFLCEIAEEERWRRKRYGSGPSQCFLFSTLRDIDILLLPDGSKYIVVFMEKVGKIPQPESVAERPSIHQSV